MKKTIRVVVIVMLTITAVVYPPQSGKSQMVDPVGNAQNTKMIALMTKALKMDAQQIKRMNENIKKVKEGLDVARETKKLFEDARKAMEIIENVNGLKLSDVDYFTKTAFEFSVNPAKYIPNIPETRKMRTRMNEKFYDPSSVQRLHYLLGGDYRTVMRRHGRMNKPRDYNKYKLEESASNQALRESARQRKIEKAQQNYILAEQLIEKSHETAEALKEKDKLQMSEGERIALLNTYYDQIFKARDLVSEADQLMLEAGEKSEEEKNFDALLSAKAYGQSIKKVKYNDLFVKSRR